MLKIRRSRDRLIFNMGIPIPGKDGLYIETWPWLLVWPGDQYTWYWPCMCMMGRSMASFTANFSNLSWFSTNEWHKTHRCFFTTTQHVIQCGSEIWGFFYIKFPHCKDLSWFWWLGGRLQYLLWQCLGDTAVWHKAVALGPQRWQFVFHFHDRISHFGVDRKICCNSCVNN